MKLSGSAPLMFISVQAKRNPLLRNNCMLRIWITVYQYISPAAKSRR